MKLRCRTRHFSRHFPRNRRLDWVLVNTSRLLLIRLLQQAPIHSVEWCLDRRFLRNYANFKPILRTKRLAELHRHEIRCAPGRSSHGQPPAMADRHLPRASAELSSRSIRMSSSSVITTASSRQPAFQTLLGLGTDHQSTEYLRIRGQRT